MRRNIELLIYLLNLIALGYLINICIDGNDKAVFALIVGQPILIVLNLIFGLLLSFFNLHFGKAFYNAAKWLTIFAVPILMIVPFLG